MKIQIKVCGQRKDARKAPSRKVAFECLSLSLSLCPFIRLSSTSFFFLWRVIAVVLLALLYSLWHKQNLIYVTHNCNCLLTNAKTHTTKRQTKHIKKQRVLNIINSQGVCDFCLFLFGELLN